MSPVDLTARADAAAFRERAKAARQAKAAAKRSQPAAQETVDQAGLEALPAFSLPPTYHLGTAGMGCAFDPPGYPSYYLRPVYTRHGDPPPYRTGQAETVLAGRVVATVDGDASVAGDAPVGKLLARLYKPLPFEDPRVAAWLDNLFRHLRGCYADPSGAARPLIPSCGDAMPEGWAVPDNLTAVRIVRETYPDFQPTEALLNGPAGLPTSWWETAATDLPGGAAAEMATRTIRQSGDPPAPECACPPIGDSSDCPVHGEA